MSGHEARCAPWGIATAAPGGLLLLGWNRWPGADTAATSSSRWPAAASRTRPPPCRRHRCPPQRHPSPRRQPHLSGIPLPTSQPSRLVPASSSVPAGLSPGGMGRPVHDALERTARTSSATPSMGSGPCTRWAEGMDQVMGLAGARIARLGATDIGCSPSTAELGPPVPRPGGRRRRRQDARMDRGKETTGNTSRLCWPAGRGIVERLDPLPSRHWTMGPGNIACSRRRGLDRHRPAGGGRGPHALRRAHTGGLPIRESPTRPDNGIPPVRVFEVETAPNGDLWAVGTSPPTRSRRS